MNGMFILRRRGGGQCIWVFVNTSVFTIYDFRVPLAVAPEISHASSAIVYEYGGFQSIMPGTVDVFNFVSD